MNDKISLTQRQILFIVDILEIDDHGKAVERFMEIMIEERTDPSLISDVVNKIMARMKK